MFLANIQIRRRRTTFVLSTFYASQRHRLFKRLFKTSYQFMTSHLLNYSPALHRWVRLYWDL